MRNEPLFLVVDLFCGAGGTTTGFEMTDGLAKVIACINHDPKAIKSHWANHPEVKHFEEDIRTLDLTELINVVKFQKSLYPNALLVLWASLECTNFSKAKGGQPRDADSRTLANHLDRYVLALNPDYIQIENVVEFMSWGPLDEYGKPVSKKKGQDFVRWCDLICSHGFRNEWKEMNSANYGAFTSRNRLFGVFTREDLPVAWPLPTHAKNPTKFSLQVELEKWKAVKEVLDFSDEGNSIFTRKKPLSDKTLERIYAGLLKYVAKGDKAFISKYFSGRPKGKVNSVDDPSATVTTFGGQSLVQAVGFTGKSVEEPAGTITCVDHHALVQAQFIAQYYGQSLTTDVQGPLGTITTKDRCALVQPKYFIDKHFGKAQNQSIDQPAGTILPTDKHRLVEVSLFIMPTNYNNGPKSIDEPSPTITANRKHHYIVNPSHGGCNTATDAPCPVIVARQDKAPLYLVQCETGRVALAVYEGDSDIMIKIKEFMVIYDLTDIKMRMLRVNELLKIQGFPNGYHLEGNQADQKKFIGNSVVPHVVKAWTLALGQRIMDETNAKVA